MRFVLFLSALWLINLTASGQRTESNDLLLAYFNADFLYDTNDDPGDYDDDFTASGRYFWGEKRYSQKLESVALLLKELNDESFPDIIVLGGIENKDVIRDLVKVKTLKKAEFIIVSPNNESRLAVLITGKKVKEAKFKTIKSEPGNIPDHSIEYLQLELNDGKLYHLFVNQWPPRSGKMAGPETSRIMCAVSLRKQIDNILNFEQDARIIALGTFNDEPTSKSILSVLSATNKRKNIQQRDLYNLFYDSHNQNSSGTVMTNGEAQMFDFIIVSPQMLRDNGGYRTGFDSGEVISGGKKSPAATFIGDEFVGGPGKHFPVIFKMKSGNL